MNEQFEIQKREYQEIDKQAIRDAFSSHKSVIYQLPTGGGKSVVMTDLITEWSKENIIILAHKKKLLTQMRSHLKKRKIRAGILGGFMNEDMDSNIVIVSVRTAVKENRLAELLKRKWDRMLIDEARNSRTNSYDAVLNAFKEKNPKLKILGVDATPYRKDKKRLDEHFEHMVISCENISSLTVKGYLQACKAIVSPIDKEALKEQVKEVANDYQMTALSNYMRQEKFLDYMVNQYEKYGEGRQCLAFAVDKAHSKDLKERFIKKGFEKVAQIDSDCTQNEIDKAYRDFESKKIQILINVEMATEGVDLPVCGCILGGRPTKSLTLYLQMVGRGTRPDGEHDYFILLDCCGWTDEFGTITTKREWSLNPEIDPNNPRKKNKVVGVREDGSYVEDLTDFIGEVIELTPEEYILKLAGGLESAATANAEIDSKAKEEMGSLKVMLLRFLMKQPWFDKNQIYFEEKIEEYAGHRDNAFEFKIQHISKKDQKYYQYPVVFNSKRYAVFKRNSYNNGEDQDEVYLSAVCGAINGEILRNKNFHTQIKEMFDCTNNLLKTKIDLSKFKQATKDAKKEMWRKKVLEEIASKGELCFDDGKRSSVWRYFAKSESGGIIEKIKFTSKGIAQHHNTIIITTSSKQFEKKYVKGEKIWDIIEDSKWGMSDED